MQPKPLNNLTINQLKKNVLELIRLIFEKKLNHDEAKLLLIPLWIELEKRGYYLKDVEDNSGGLVIVYEIR